MAEDQARRLTERAQALLRAMEAYAFPTRFTGGHIPDLQRTGNPIPFILPGGVMDGDQDTPPLAHHTVQPDGGITAHRETPLRGGPSIPVLPHENDSQKETAVTVTATPKDNREAWLKLVSHLERQLLATRENAKAMQGLYREDGSPMVDWRPEATTPTDWQATAWAAQRLLDQLKDLQAPQIPLDPEPGQGSILDLACGVCGHPTDAGGCRRPHPVPLIYVDKETGEPCPTRAGNLCDLVSPHHRHMDQRHWRPSSTSGDEPVEYRPRRLIDDAGDRWEELEDGRWAYVPVGAEDPKEGDTPYQNGALNPYGPVFDRDMLERMYTLRDPIGDEYDKGARP